MGSPTVLFVGCGSWCTDVLDACCEQFSTSVITYANEASRLLSRDFGPNVHDVVASRMLEFGEEPVPPRYNHAMWNRQYHAVVASNWRHVIPAKVVDRVNSPVVNVHRGTLPKYAGFSPINWAVALGATETDIIAHLMEPLPDAGPTVYSERLAIGPSDTATEVYRRSRSIAPRVTLRALEILLAGGTVTSEPRKPPEVLRPFRTGALLRIAWGATSDTVYNHIRAQSPPFEGTYFRKGERTYFVESCVKSNTLVQAGPGTVIETRGIGNLVVACGSGAVDISIHHNSQTRAQRIDAHTFKCGEVLD